MFCAGCGAKADDSAKFCAQCGTSLCPALHGSSVAGQRSRRRKILWISGAGVGLLCLLLTVVPVRKAEHLDETLKATAKEGGSDENVSNAEATPPRVSEPPLAGVSLHAYDLVKNPYGHKNHLVAVDVLERPVLFNRSLIQYAGGADPRVLTELGMAGVRLDKMLAEDTALYDVMGLNANENSDPEVVGQLVVLLPSGRGELELSRPWEVEPLGTTTGTNAFGASVLVPEVRFWRYSDERQQDSPRVVLSGDGLTAVELVKARIRPSAYLNSLNADQSSAQWYATDNHSACLSCWYVFFSITAATDQWDRNEWAEWKVNISSKTVTPGNQKAKKLYDLVAP